MISEFNLASLALKEAFLPASSEGGAKRFIAEKQGEEEEVSFSLSCTVPRCSKKHLVFSSSRVREKTLRTRAVGKTEWEDQGVCWVFWGRRLEKYHCTQAKPVRTQDSTPLREEMHQFDPNTFQIQASQRCWGISPSSAEPPAVI